MKQLTSLSSSSSRLFASALCASNFFAVATRVSSSLCNVTISEPRVFISNSFCCLSCSSLTWSLHQHRQYINNSTCLHHSWLCALSTASHTANITGLTLSIPCTVLSHNSKSNYSLTDLQAIASDWDLNHTSKLSLYLSCSMHLTLNATTIRCSEALHMKCKWHILRIQWHNQSHSQQKLQYTQTCLPRSPGQPQHHKYQNRIWIIMIVTTVGAGYQTT